MTNISISSSVWSAVKATEQILENVLQDNDRDVEILRVDINASEPFGENGEKRDCFVKLFFARGSLYGSIKVWILLQNDGRRRLTGFCWTPTLARVISIGRQGPGSGQSFRFQNGVVSPYYGEEADLAWWQASQRRILQSRIC